MRVLHPVNQPAAKFCTSMRRACIALLLVALATPAQAIPEDEAQKTRARIPAGDIILDATLFRPKGATGKIPALVLGHGSGKDGLEPGDYWVDFALRTGMAVLAYDKRGTGRSTGKFIEWDTKKSAAMFQQLAVDMNYAVRWVAKQPGIDGARIGLAGGSQAGWPMPLAASQEPLIKFVIVGEGVPLPAGVEVAHSTYLDLVSKDGEGNPLPRHLAAADILSMEAVGSPDEPLGYDPRPILENLKTPVLWMFGLYDGVIPGRASIEQIGKLNKAGKLNHEIHIFPFGNHNYQNVFTKENYDVADVAGRWLRKIGLLDKEYLEELKNGTSDQHAQIAWTSQIVEARLNPPELSAASLLGPVGKYEGGRHVIVRNGKLFYRRADGLERELVPLAPDLFALGEYTSTSRLRFNRHDSVIDSATFMAPDGPGLRIAREGS